MSDIEVMLNLYKKQLADAIEECNLFKAKYIVLQQQYEKLKQEKEENKKLISRYSHRYKWKIRN